MPDAQLETLSKEFAFSLWERMGEGRSAARFCTSWATKEENVEKLIQALRELS